MKKLAATIALLLLVTYLILAQILQKATFQTGLQQDYANSKLQEAKFTLGGGDEISILYNKKNGARDVILYFHGNAGRLPYILDHLADSEYSFIAPAYPGYNGSSGSPTIGNIYDTVTKLIPMVMEVFGPEVNLHILGHSLGSQTAVYFASKFEGPIKTIMLVAGFDSVYSLCKARLGTLWPACIVAKNSFNALSYPTSELNSRLVSFHKVDDSIVPFSLGLRLFNGLKAEEKEFLTLEDGTHGHFDIETVLERAIAK